MVTLTLLDDSLFTALLVFCRVGGMVSLLPGLGEQTIPMRVRLLIALALTFLITPLVGGVVPSIPQTVAGLAALIVSETLIGAAFGAVARLFMGALSMAGQIMGLQTGIAVAQTFDPAQGQSGALFAIFLNIAAVVLIFVTGLHHQMIIAMVGTYQVLTPGSDPMIGDFAQLAINISGEAIVFALRMAAPLILFGLVFNAGMGVMAKMMPAMQVFMVAMPITITGGMAIFALTAGTGLMIWLTRYGEFLQNWQ